MVYHCRVVLAWLLEFYSNEVFGFRVGGTLNFWSKNLQLFSIPSHQHALLDDWVRAQSHSGKGVASRKSNPPLSE